MKSFLPTLSTIIFWLIVQYINWKWLNKKKSLWSCDITLLFLFYFFTIYCTNVMTQMDLAFSDKFLITIPFPAICINSEEQKSHPFICSTHTEEIIIGSVHVWHWKLMTKCMVRIWLGFWGGQKEMVLSKWQKLVGRTEKTCESIVRNLGEDVDRCASTVFIFINTYHNHHLLRHHLIHHQYHSHFYHQHHQHQLQQ